MLESFSEANKDNNESLSLFIVKKSPEIKIEELKAQAEEVLECVFAANEAWVPSKEIISNIITREDDINNKNFLQWLINNNFIFLATCTGDSSGKVENLNGLLKNRHFAFQYY